LDYGLLGYGIWSPTLQRNVSASFLEQKTKPGNHNPIHEHIGKVTVVFIKIIV
jgi:hypothetical protein